jgi:hypothetical protein
MARIAFEKLKIGVGQLSNRKAAMPRRRSRPHQHELTDYAALSAFVALFAVTLDYPHLRDLAARSARGFAI